MKSNAPESWEDISVKKWKELRSLDPSEFDGLIDFQIEKFSLLLGVESWGDYWDKITSKDFIKLNKRFKWVNNPPDVKPKKQIGKFHYKGFDGIKLGDYIDLEYWHVNDFIKNIERIAAIQYRQQKTGEWGEKIVEPYSTYSTKDRIGEFENLKITDIYGVVVEFLDFRDKFMDKYGPLFNDGDAEEEEEDEVRNSESVKEKELAKRSKRWAWEKMIHKITDRDLTKYKDVIELPLIFVFNNLAMRLELEI